MTLYEWILEQLLPLFGVMPTEQPLPNFLSCQQIFDLIFWTSLSLVVVFFLVWLPFRLITKACGIRWKWLPWINKGD